MNRDTNSKCRREGAAGGGVLMFGYAPIYGIISRLFQQVSHKDYESSRHWWWRP